MNEMWGSRIIHKLQGLKLSQRGDSVMSTPSALQLSNPDWLISRTSQHVGGTDVTT
jgi:hypothetical protein